MRKMRAMKKLLAGILAAAIATSCVLTVSAADPSHSTPPQPGPEIMDDVPVTQKDGLETKMDTKEDGTAALGQVEKTSSKTVSISGKVTVNGVKYTVTTVDSKAFAKCAKATKVSLPSTIEVIKKNAFAGAAKLKTAEIKGKPVLKAGALSGAAKLKTVTFTNAPTASKNAFKGANLNKLVVNKGGTFKKGAFAGATVKKLVVSKKTVFAKGAFTGNSTKNSTVTVSGKMTDKQYDNFVKMMRAAGFKGKIKKA